MIKVKDFKLCSSFIKMSVDLDSHLDVEISTDTRSLQADQFFLAITGERFNAVNFLDQVVEKGCKYAIYTESEENNKIISKFQGDLTFISTNNSVTFLQEITSVLATKFQRSGGKLIGISGSNGKTTTKEMLYHLLKNVHEETVCTQKNNNNHIGVPLTLLQINEQTKFAVVELGSNHPGEIKVLCDIACPAIGVTTNIGDTHMEFFETRENVFKEEGYLCDAVLSSDFEDKKFFVNADDEYLKANIDKDHSLSFGYKGVDYKFTIEKDKVVVNNNGHEYIIVNQFITGKHNFYNLCVAFTIAKEIDSSNTQQYLEVAKTFRPTANRSEWLKINNTKVFLDAYNANPSSMLSAIEGFVDSVGPDSNYCLVIGDMYELGKNSDEYHENLARTLSQNSYKNFYFVGQFASQYNKGCDGKGSEYSSADSFKNDFVSTVLTNHKYVFIKGSRSLQLESLVDIN